MQNNSNGSLRIALVLAHLYRKGGVQLLGAEIANHLAEQGHRVMVLAEYSPKKGASTAHPLHPSVEIAHFSHRKPHRSRALLQQFQTDCCVALYSWREANHWLQVLARSGIPLLYSEHSDPNAIESIDWNPLERRTFCAAADTIHLLTTPFINSIPPHYRSKVVVIPNFIRYSPTEATREERPEKVLLSLGRLEPIQKQLSLMIDAFALLAPEFPQWRLEIWGEGPDQERLRQKIDTLGVQQQVALLGVSEQPHEQYRNADLFCIPSKFEGFPLVVAEAMAHGIPVVGFAGCSGVNTIVQHGVNGLLAPEMSTVALANELRLLMSDDSIRQQMGRQALERSRDYDRAAILQQWEEMIVQTAQKKGATALDAMLRAAVDRSHPSHHSIRLWKMFATPTAKKTVYREWRQNRWARWRSQLIASIPLRLRLVLWRWWNRRGNR